MMKKTINAACVQAAPVFLDLATGVDKTIALIRQAAENGADIVAFPETFLPGYPWFLWLDSPAWGMQFIQRYHENSLVLGSEQALRISEAARSANIHVVMGYSERDAGSLYIGQWIIDNQGRTLATRRKLKPTHVERALFGEGDGASLSVVDTTLGVLGALSCWEHLQPLSKYALYAQHEQIHVAAWPSFSLYRGAAEALGPEVNVAASRIYAAEGQCFVLAPCGVVSPEMIDILCGDDTRKHVLLKAGGGYARIFGPDGSSLAEPLGETAEGIIYADLNPAAIIYGKAAADPAGHYSRPDVVRLLINRAPNRNVVEFQLPFAEAAGIAPASAGAGTD